MSIQTDSQLTTAAAQIRDEISAGANTATRVGTHLVNAIDSKASRLGVFAVADINSMIDGDVSSYVWTTHAGASPSASAVHVVPAVATTGSYLDASLVNPAGNATGTGSLETSMTLPPGTTSGVFSVPIASVSGSTTVKLALLDSSRAEISSTIVTVNTTEATYTHSPSGLSAGTQYYLSIQVNNSGQQAAVYVGRVTFTPGAGGSGVFGGNFRRIRVTPGMLMSFGAAAVGGNYFGQLGQSDCEYITDTTNLAYEYWGETASIAPAYFHDNRPFIVGLNVTGGKSTLQIVTAPSPGLMGVRNSVSGSTGGVGVRWGTKLRAIYIPQAATFEPISRGGRRLIVYGDSITDGGVASQPLYNGWVARVRRWFPGITAVDAYSGRQFFYDAQTSAQRQALAQLWASWGPTDIWLAIGINDYSAFPWTAAQFGSAYGDLLDKIHAIAPATLVWCQSMLLNANENSHGSPNTLPDFRAAISSAVSTRTTFATYVDGSNATGPGAGFWPIVADLFDGTHPTTNGHGKYAEAVILTLQSGGVM